MSYSGLVAQIERLQGEKIALSARLLAALPRCCAHCQPSRAAPTLAGQVSSQPSPKPSPAQASPAQASPAQASPAHASPAQASPAQASPAQQAVIDRLGAELEEARSELMRAGSRVEELRRAVSLQCTESSKGNSFYSMNILYQQGFVVHCSQL